MHNRAELIGHLGKDPILDRTPTGTPVTTLDVATNDSYTDRRNGEKVKTTEWHTVTVFGKIAENCCRHLSKGRLVYIEGSIYTDKWKDQQGENRYWTKIKASKVLFLGKGDDDDYKKRRDKRGFNVNSQMVDHDPDDRPIDMEEETPGERNGSE